MSIRYALDTRTRQSRIADSRITESFPASENDPLEEHTPDFHSKRSSTQRPLRRNLSGCFSSSAVSPPPSTVECFTPQRSRINSSFGTIFRSQRVEHNYLSNTPSEISDLTHNPRRRASLSALSLPIFPTPHHNQLTETHNNVGIKQNEPIKLPLECSKCTLTTKPPNQSKRSEVGSTFTPSPSPINRHRAQNARARTNCLSESTRGQFGDQGADSGLKKIALGNCDLKSSTEALLIDERRNISQEELMITQWQQSASNGYNTPKRLQSLPARYGHQVASLDGSLVHSRSLLSNQNNYSLNVIKDSTRFHRSENSPQVLSTRKSSLRAGVRYGINPSSLFLSRPPTPSSNEHKLTLVLKNVPADTCCAGALPRSGSCHQHHIIEKPSHQHHILAKPLNQRYPLAQVRPSGRNHQNTSSPLLVRSASRQDICGTQLSKNIRSQSLSSRDFRSTDRMSSERRSTDVNSYNNSITLPKRLSCEVDMEIISPFKRDVLQIMADHGESITRPPIPIEFSVQMQPLKSLTEKGFMQLSKPLFESEASKIKPSSTHSLHSSNGYSTKPADKIPPAQRPRSSPNGFSLRKLSGIESRLKKNSLFARPSVYASIPRSQVQARDRSDLEKIKHYSDLDSHGQDSLITKTQKFEALLKASDASIGGTIKMSLSTKIENMSENNAVISRNFPLGLNQKFLSTTNNWISSFGSMTLEGSDNNFAKHKSYCCE